MSLRRRVHCLSSQLDVARVDAREEHVTEDVYSKSRIDIKVLYSFFIFFTVVVIYLKAEVTY